MRITRAMIGLLLVLAALAVAGPGLALASGPSAGDQQYTDPLGGSHGSGSKSSGSSSGSSGSASSSIGSSSASSTPSSSAPVASSSSSTSSAPSTLASAPASSSTSTAGGGLPRTGFDAWLAAAFGAALLGAGVLVRRGVLRR